MQQTRKISEKISNSYNKTKEKVLQIVQTS